MFIETRQHFIEISILGIKEYFADGSETSLSIIELIKIILGE